MTGMEVITAPVSPLGTIEERAEELMSGIAKRIQGEGVNIIA